MPSKHPRIAVTADPEQSVSVDLWDGRGAVLADTSAWMLARRLAPAREMLFAAAERGELAWCWPVR